MDRERRRWLIFGLAAGAAASVGALLVRRAQAARLALARRADGITKRAVEGLEKGAESRFVDVNGLNLHIVVMGPDDGPLAVLLHGFPECWYSWTQSTRFLRADRSLATQPQPAPPEQVLPMKVGA